MKIAFLTSQEFPLLTPDDRLAVGALKRRKVEVVPWIWDGSENPSVSFTVIRSPWDYHEKLDKFLQFFKDLNLPVYNSRSTVEWNYDKSYLLELKKKGIPIVPTEKVSSEAELLGIWKGERAVIKPTVSAGARRTVRWQGEKTENLAWIGKNSPALYQPYLSSIETDGEVSLIFYQTHLGEKVFGHGVIKHPASGDFRVQVHLGGKLEPWQAPPPLVHLAERILESLSVPWLYARVDLVDWRTEPKLGEIELIEPSLYLRQSIDQGEKFSEVVCTYF